MKARTLNAKNRIVSFFLALAMLMVLMPAKAEAAVSLPSISSGTPLKAYGLKTGNNTRTYSDRNLSKGIGYIYASDLVTITSVQRNSNGVWVCYGYYPVSKGNKWAYWYLSDMSTQSAPSEKNTSRSSMTVYRRSSGSATVGSIAKGDTVYRMTEANGRTQVIYNLGSASRPTGWKMGWIPTTSYNNSIRPVNNSTQKTNSGNNSGSGWQMPMSNAYVCGNNWLTYYKARPSRPYHLGLDLASRTGDSNVYAAAAGTVAATGYNSANGYYVIIRHSLSGTTVYSFYCHLKANSICVSKNASVSKGKKIAVMGNTGSSSAGAHLHFAIMNTLWSGGGYYGYGSTGSGNKASYSSVVYYNPTYVVNNSRLP